MSSVKRAIEKKSPKTNGRTFRPKVDIVPSADWDRVDAEQLRSTIAMCALHGGALRLGYTRDGGAFSIGIYGDGPEAYTVYVRPNENMEEFLVELEQTFHAKSGTVDQG